MCRSAYKAWAIPLILRTMAVPSAPVSHGDKRIVHSGNATASSEGRLPGPVHIASAAGASAELSFTGTVVEYFADRDAAFGSVDVSIDGGARQAVSRAVENFSRVCGSLRVAVFRVRAGRRERTRFRLSNARRHHNH